MEQVRSIAALLGMMDRQLAGFDQSRDHRAAFLRVYRRMTAEVQAHLTDAFFLDPAWVEQVAVRFSGYYFDALERFDAGDSPPPAWALAFTVARERRAFLLQDVLLGMNAHINNDLPLVVAEMLAGETDPAAVRRRRFDHDQINRVLHEVIPAVEAELSQTYGRLILPLGRLMGTLDQTLATYGLKTWRDNVWRNGLFLRAAVGEAERGLVVAFIQRDALDVGEQILQFPPLRWCRPLARVMRGWRLC